MPFGGGVDAPADPDAFEQAAAALPVPQSMHTGQVLGSALTDFSKRATQFGSDIVDQFTQPRLLNPDTGFTHIPELDSETANEKYGIDGVLRFNQPVTDSDAAFQNRMAQERQATQYIFSRTNPQPLTDFAAGIGGSLLDPAGLATMVATGGLGEAAVGAFDLLRGAKAVSEAVPAVTNLGRLANAGGQGARLLTVGALDNAPYVAANAFLTNRYGDEYSTGDALRDIAAGAILHTGLHLAFRGARGLWGGGGDPDGLIPSGADPNGPGGPPSGMEPNPVPRVPPEVEALPMAARQGAFVKALDDASNDRPVDVGRYIERELNPPALSALDERSAAPEVASFRPGADAMAVTTRGTEIAVRYGLAELGDLVTSHDDNLGVNPAFPSELQPRERDRAGAMARNYQLESELNPKLLMNDVNAAAGAPIVSPDGIVESGNGRTIALRRSAAKEGAPYQAYKAELAAQGYDTTGMAKPVLVHMRSEPLTGSQRSGLVHEMNADVTERMSATEQATADARGIDAAALSHLQTEGVAGRRAFAKAFLQRVAPDQINSLIAPDGALSKAGQDRIDAALVAKAYGDPRLIEALFETGESNIKAIGQALKEVAPEWAAMRSAIARGDVPAALDMTEALRNAVDLVRNARDKGVNTGRHIGELLDQTELFGGRAVSEETEAVLRLLFLPGKEGAPAEASFTRARSAAKVADALRDYARQAQDFTPGPNLFGVEPDATDARQILADVARRFTDGDAGQLDLLRPPGRTEGGGDGGGGETPAARTPVIDVRQPEQERNGGTEGGRPADKPGAGGEGGAVVAGEPAKPLTSPAEAAIAADPELKTLRDDVERLAAQYGFKGETPPNEEPKTLADAIHAAAVCLVGELG